MQNLCLIPGPRWGIFLWTFVVMASGPPTHADEVTPTPTPVTPVPAAIESIVLQAFLDTHGGYSVDETLINLQRFDAFQSRCRELAGERSLEWPEDLNESQRWFAEALLHLRKTGRIGKVTTQRAPRPGDKAPARDAYRFAVEIAARQIQIEHQVHTDEVLIDLELRQAFIQTARSVCGDLPGLTDELLLRDALRLRKSRRLRPELVARVVDWGRTVTVHPTPTPTPGSVPGSPPESTLGSAPGSPPESSESFTEGQSNLALDEWLADIPTAPGVYVFRDATGYLYIGEAKNLRSRLAQHLGRSDRSLLADYLAQHGDAESIQVEVHAFAPESDARLAGHRRAYESDLIATRKPRFNLRP